MSLSEVDKCDKNIKERDEKDKLRLVGRNMLCWSYTNDVKQPKGILMYLEHAAKKAAL